MSKKKKNFGTGVQSSIQSTLRVKEDASDVKNGRFDMSAAAEHAIFEQHALDFDNVEVIDCERHGWKWRVKEALHINAKKHSMNKDGLIYWNWTQSGSASSPNTLCRITYLVSQLPTRYQLLYKTSQKPAHSSFLSSNFHRRPSHPQPRSSSLSSSTPPRSFLTLDIFTTLLFIIHGTGFFYIVHCNFVYFSPLGDPSTRV